MVISIPKTEDGEFPKGVDLRVLNGVFNHVINRFGQEKFDSAFKFAYKYLDGVERDSGEPFIMHQLRTVDNMIQMNPDLSLTVLIAGMTHDTPEENKLVKLYETLDKGKNEVFISEKFGERVAYMIDAISTIKDDIGPLYLQSVYYWLDAAVEEPEVIELKLGDRVDNMKTLDGKVVEKWIPIALDTKLHHLAVAEYMGYDDVADQLMIETDKYLPSGTIIPYSKELIQSMLIEREIVPYNKKSYARVA